MKLVSLELAGFKSFADPTVFLFDAGITGIVGPNGCGKSNVVDAVKWVLGEMSAKSLRGDGMMDVIFNGSSTRKPLGMAEVSLTFSNEDRRLPVEDPQVKITRRLYRDGTSEYLVNNKDARLRDIREMFLDTGVGVDAYSLIEQGRITALLEANSADRREIFEEAAGISRFKARKKETLRRLEKTDQNLSQTQLVLDEVLRQLRSIKVQAGKARNFKEYEARLLDLRRMQVLFDFHQMHQRLMTLNSDHADAADLLSLKRREMDGRQVEYNDLQLDFNAAQDAVRQAERTLSQTENQHQSFLQQTQFANQQHLQLQEQHKLLQDRRSDIQLRMTGLSDAIEVQSRSVASAENQASQVQDALKQVTEQLEAENTRLGEIIRASEKMKLEAVDLLRQVAVIRNQLSGLDVQRENLSRQLMHLQAKRQAIVERQAAASQDIVTMDAQKLQIEAQLSQDMTEINALEADRSTNNIQQAAVSEKLSQARELRSGLLSRTNVLKELQSRKEGVSAPVKEILKAREAGTAYPSLRGVLSDLIDADLPHAKLIEIALGDLASALVFDSMDRLGDDFDRLRALSGRIHVWFLDQLPAATESESAAIASATPANSGQAVAGGQLPRLLDWARCSPEFQPLVEYLLGRTLVAETLAQARDHARSKPGFQYVIQDGELLRAGGLLTLGRGGQATGTIARRSELAQLASQVSAVEQEVAEFQKQLALIDQKAAENASMLRSRRDRHLQMQNESIRLGAKLSAAHNDAERIAAELPLLELEQAGLEQQSAKCQQQQEQLQQKAADMESQGQAAEEKAKSFTADIDTQRQAVSKVSERATSLRIDLGRLQEQRTAIMRELGAARQNHQEAQGRLNQVDLELVSVQQRAAESQQAAQNFAQQAKNAGAQYQTARESVDGCLARLADVNLRRSEIQSDMAARQSELDRVIKHEHELSLAENEASVRLETLVERTGEELSINLVEAHSQYLPPADVDWQATANEVSELKAKIARLGNVNLDAVAELETLEAREAFLTAQMTDILDAKKQLEDLIAKINDDSRVRFAQTFEAVRGEFQETFRLLFGGGKADVVLENPEDVLESGIEILARPPGKELQSISLMSGGEKALTAIALVLAVFKSRPSPFCILDEVDAPLDEANTGRFASIIQQFLGHSQFVVITHNKRMMTVADLLYGITMQEQGVSRRVSVKFDGKARLQAAGPAMEAASV